MYKFLLKPFFFQFTPEKAHHLTMRLFRFALGLPFGKSIFRSLFVLKNAKLERKIMGLTFPNPVGLAAGFDKDGKYFEDLQYLGFGFIEIGTVTPRPQDGNPQPRLFRLPEHEALINRMGFNNEGVESLVNRLKNRNPTEGVLIGGNIGKNKVTPNEEAFRDYELCFNALFDFVDYFVVNVSSPNTPDLRALQDKEPLNQLLAHVQNLNQKQANPKPLLLKIAPDLNESQLDDILEIVENNHLNGIIATNTTLSRDMVKTHPLSNEAGGLSGKPVKSRSTEVIRYLRSHAKRQNLVIIGVGGIQTGDDALEKLQAGADLVQVYSGLIYEGPSIVKKINQTLLKSL
ncbi:MAG: quinone-dependent dihydroorotate dehydrogenase [Saprospiraceae bacterium]|nr:quinone-dependent dihydroorotate dehydrogenase [Saprospiraceae bacterium]